MKTLTVGLYGTMSRQTNLDSDDLVRFSSLDLTVDWVIINRLGLSARHSWIDQESDVSGLDDLSYSRTEIFLSARLLQTGGGRSVALFSTMPRRLSSW